MLYAYDLLCRKPKGKFAVIWRLANGLKVSKRDIMKVSISQTIKELQKMIVEQPPYYSAITSESRLSIYLSTKLCHGTMIAFDRQLDMFIDDFEKLLSFQEVKTPPKELEKEKETGVRKERGKRKRDLRESETFMQVTRTQDSVPVIEITDFGIDLLKHIDEEGAAVRADERTITLPEDVPITAPLEDAGFGETSEQALSMILLTLHEDREESKILEGTMREQPKSPEPRLLSPKIQPHGVSVRPPRELPAPGSPVTSPARKMSKPSHTVEVPVSPTLPEPQVVRQPESQVPGEVSEMAVQLSPITFDTLVRPEPQPQPQRKPQLQRALELDTLSPEVIDMERRRRRRGRRRKRFIFRDESTIIFVEEIEENRRNSGKLLRVQDAHEDEVNIRKLHYEIPANQLLKNVSRNIHLQQLITRHYETEPVTTDEEIYFQDIGERYQHPKEVDKIQPTDKMQKEVEVPQPSDMIQAEAMEIQPADIVQQEVEISQVLDVTRREPEDVQFPVIPQEKAEGAVGFEQSKIGEELQKPPDSIPRSEVFPEAVYYVISKLEELQVHGGRTTFAELCPPRRFNRETAELMFGTILEMQDLKLLTLHQDLTECPPQLPHPPIYIEVPLTPPE